MPRSIFLGRPMPAPGEPLFLREDTAAAMALAEEEADTCPMCGMPKAVCRDNKDGRKRFDVREEFCWAAYRVGLRNALREKENVAPAQQNATRVYPTFRKGYEPDPLAGLVLADRAEHEDRQDGERD